jgi:hypothetical protein
MGRFETKWLRQPENLAALADLPGQWKDRYIVVARRGSFGRGRRRRQTFQEILTLIARLQTPSA